MTAIDGGTGEVENTAVMTAHLTVAGKTIDVPMRWRGVGNAPAAEYPRQPSEMWTGVWTVPADTPIGVINYTVTATDRFGRTATFTPLSTSCRNSPSSNNTTESTGLLRGPTGSRRMPEGRPATVVEL